MKPDDAITYICHYSLVTTTVDDGFQNLPNPEKGEVQRRVPGCCQREVLPSLIVNSQRHIAVPRSLGRVLGYDQTAPAYLEGLGFQDRSMSPDPPGIRKPSVHLRWGMVHLRWKWFLSLFRTVALPFPLVTTPSC